MKTNTVRSIMGRQSRYRVGVLGLALLASACGGPTEDAGAGDGVPEAEAGAPAAFARIINVEVRPVETRAFAEQIRLTGVVWASRDVQVSAEETGVIREIVVDRGRRVSAGQPLFRIDSSVLRAQVAQARAQADLAEQTWERRRRLYEQDQVGSELAYLEARSMAQQTAANLQSLEARLARTTIRAPFAGIMDERMVELGTLVSSGQVVARIVDLSTVKVVAGVPERYAADVRPGGEATVLFDVLTGEEYPTTIHYVGSTVNPQTRSFPIEIRMGNPGGLVKPEMVSNILVKRNSLTEAVVVPQDALVRVEEGYVVFVAEESAAGPVARVRPVVLGARQNDEVVIEAGLDPADRLIVVGQKSVADGDRINVVVN